MFKNCYYLKIAWRIVVQKILKKFIISFILIVFTPFLLLIFFQKSQVEKEPLIPSVPPMVHGQGNLVPPTPPMAPPTSIPVLLLSLSCLGSCFIWVKYLKKTFIAPLEVITKGLSEFDKGNFDIKFKTDSENDFMIKTFKTLNVLVENTKEKEKLKSNYIQNLVHDLRSPILAQERALKILKEEFNNHELLIGMEENTEKYIGMINLILESYKVNSSNLKIEKKEILFDDLIMPIIKELKPLANEKNITINYLNFGQNKVIYADYFSFIRVMTNLIANSIENIEYDKKITVKIKDGEKTLIIVEDNGMGIDEETLKTLFERYSSNSKTKVVSGLGLNIVKELVEKNNGTITVDSKVGSYTRFIITLDKKGN